LQGDEYQALKQEYLDAILRGDRRVVTQLVTDARAQGVAVVDLYEHIIGPAMHRLGDLWYQDEISVAQEHVATAVTELILAQCYDWLLEDTEPTIEGAAVLACPGEEQHHLGLRMFADILDAMGMDTYYLGARTPVDELPGMLRRVDARLLGLSISMPANLPALQSALEIIHRSFPGIPVLVGGRGIARRENLLDSHGIRFAPTIGVGMSLARRLLTS